jgi:transposase
VVGLSFVGGAEQARFVERIRDVERDRLLVAPIDVGKHTAAAMVCDFWGEIIAAPFEFALNEEGFRELRAVLARCEAERDAAWVRVGLEQAGHYHDTLHARLCDEDLDVAVLNPSQVKENRNQDLLRSLKSDARDLGAMAELLIRGKGRPAAADDGPLARQTALASHRRRKVKARTALKNQVLSTLDLVFPGLDGCFNDMLNTKLGQLLLAEGLTPDRITRLGASRLRRFAVTRGVMVTRPKANQIVLAAKQAFRLPRQRGEVLLDVLRSDVSLLETLEHTIDDIERRSPMFFRTHLRRCSCRSHTSASSERRPTAQLSAIRCGSQAPRRSTGCRGSSPASTSRLDEAGEGHRSAGRARSSCAKPSSSSARHCVMAIPTSRAMPPR